MRAHSNQYEREIEQAKRSMQIYLEAEKNMGQHENPHRGDTWESIEARLFTPEEIAEADEWVKKIGKKIEAREARERRALAKPPVSTHRPQGEQLAVAGA